MKRALARAALLAFAVLLSLAVVEQALRWAGYEYRPMSVKIGKTTDARYFHLFGDRHFVYDPELIWRPKPGYEIFNAQGFRGPLMDGERDPGALLVVAIGDSNTLGWAGESGANWPAALGAVVAGEGPGGEVVNGGVWGYSSFQGVRRMREALQYKPDVVLVSYGSNDAHRVRRVDREFAGKSSFFRSFERRFNHYRLGQLITATTHRLGGGSDAPLRPRVSLPDYKRNLREIARLGREAGARVAFLTRPFVGPITAPDRWKNFAYEYNAATVEIAIEEGVPVIDLYTEFKGRAEHFRDESHFTNEGHAQAGRFVYNELQPVFAAIKGELR